MGNSEIIIYLLPLVFMIHDFEEIIGFKAWFTKNGTWLQAKYPRFREQISHLETMSVPSFALAVAEEFILISIATIIYLLFEWPYAWLAFFTAFAFHIGIHIIQFIIIRKYIPVIITSFLSIPYIIIGIDYTIHSFSFKEIAICFSIGLLVAITNLILVHKITPKLDKLI